MSTYRKDVGRAGETIATHYLKQQGYLIRDRNFRTRSGEIDIIAEKDHTISFVEVKTKINLKQGKPYEEVTWTKIRSLRRVVDAYVSDNALSRRKLSLDVISIIVDNTLTVLELKHYKNIDL